jgi:hypothetical protein
LGFHGRPVSGANSRWLSTDGFAAYPEAIDLAFGPFVKYGTIIKDYRNATMIYTPSEMIARSGKLG